jgi:hypothetical protein
MNTLYILAIFFIFTNAIEMASPYTQLEDLAGEFKQATGLPEEQVLPYTIVNDEEILEFASTLTDSIKKRIQERGKEEIMFFLENLLEGQEVELLNFGEHQMRVSADGKGLDVLMELKVNKDIDIEIKCFVSKVTGTFVISELIGSCPPFKTFEDLEEN